MALGAVVTILQTVLGALEDLWIGREALGWHLRQKGYSVDELKRICADAKLDPQLREQARCDGEETPAFSSSDAELVFSFLPFRWFSFVNHR